MAKKNDKTELPKNVPIIKVRQQFITKCGTTCAGQGHEREKRWPPCGPSPPVSVGSNVTCGLPDCYDEETCRCRCPCTLKEMMRMAAEPPSAQETPATQQSVQTVPQMHLARIYTLEPKLPHWWYIFGGAPPEPCRGGHCFFGSPARTFNTTAEVLGELPEWNLEPIRRVCRSCMGGSKKMYCPRRKSSLTGRKPDLKKGVERICR